MRITHVTAPAEFGGLERVVSGLVRASSERGHAMMLVLTLGEGDRAPEWATRLSDAGVRVEILNLGARAYLAERRAVDRLLRDHGTEILHCHGYRSDVMISGVARRQSVPVVSTAHGFSSSDWRGRLYELMQSLAWRRFNAVVAVSRPLARRLALAGVPSAVLTTIVNGMAEPELLSRKLARGSLGLPPDGRIVGWVGRFSEEKNPALAISAFAALEDTSLSLCLVGDGKLREQCRALAKSRGIKSRVYLPGALPDAGRAMSAFDALLVSSKTEGTPMVILEAAAARVPVISTAVGGVPDMLADGRGWLAPETKPDSLAHALRHALDEPEEAASRADRLHAFVFADQQERYDWVDCYLALYQRILQATDRGVLSRLS